MTRKLQLLLTTLLLTIVGVTGAWADVVTISPEKEAYLRVQPETSNWKFSKIELNSTSQNFELNYGGAGFFVIQQYSATNLKDADVIRLVFTIENNSWDNEFGCWYYDQTYPSSESAADIAGYMKTIMGKYPNAKNVDGTADSDAYTTALATRNSSEFLNPATSDGKKIRTIVIDGTSLSTLKTNVGDAEYFNLVITSTGSRAQIYSNSSSTEGFKPTMRFGYPVKTTIDETTTNHLSLSDAMTTVSSSGKDASITIYEDVEISTQCLANENKSLTILPGKDGIKIWKRKGWNSTTLFSAYGKNSESKARSLTLGTSEKQFIIDGNSESVSSKAIETSDDGVGTITNVKIQNFITSSTQGIVCAKGSSYLYLNNVTFDNCTPPDNYGVVFAGCSNLFLQNAITFTNCEKYNFYSENKYLRVGDLASEQAAPFTILYKTPSLGAVILSSANGGDKSSLFQLMNENYGIVKNSGHYTDHVLTEAYTTNITSAGAATLMLPFVSKIPAGVAAYTLNYTAGKTYVKATEVTGGTLSANTPVLLNAEAGKYWFINTTNVASATTDDGANHTVGALVGVYTDTYCPADDYLLGVKDEVVAFYHPAGENTNYIRVNRAYLHADGAGARLTVNFDDEEETTGIENLTPALSKGEGAVFDLSGRRVAQPTKGLYIVNGKKVVIK